MMNSQHHKLDLSSDPPLSPSQQTPQPEPSAGSAGRPFVGIEFTCCGRYARIYQNRDRTHYVGNCPKCAKPVRLRIGTGGSDSRFFTAY
ncbi:MAG: hypothetical protein WD045_14945 [Pirellulaceae bacterium]